MVERLGFELHLILMLSKALGQGHGNSGPWTVSAEAILLFGALTEYIKNEVH